MKLKSLKLIARGANGWESPTLRFGSRTTSLFAPNGSGKTPLVQSIAFCLGFDAKFQNDIRDKCEAAELTVEHNHAQFTIRRDFGEFHATVRSGNDYREFWSERDLSRALFEELGMSVPVLVGTNRQATPPYVSSLLPIFYVRQIGGYDEPYRAPAMFITDQFVEMIRFAFGLGPKRSYTAQKDLLAARDRLDAEQRKIVFQQKVVADIAATVDDSPATIDRLNQRATILREHLGQLRESSDLSGAANDALLDLLHSKEEHIRDLRRQQADLRSRLAGMDAIRGEIEGEIKTLSLNEESRRVLESFFDVCGRSDCGLFTSSTESYAKNLLYLKDQIKDLENNAGRYEIHLTALAARVGDEEGERAAIASKIEQSQERNATHHLVTAVQSLTRELLDIEQQLVAIDRLKAEKGKYLQFDQARTITQDRIANLSNRGKSDFSFNALRREVQTLTVKWMDILGTPNASREVELDLDFKFRFGGQAIDVFNGSTRSRLILAIHAALFEHYLADIERPLRFLILDTPKQQELASTDLWRYLTALEEVCDERGGQILISATEYHHEIGEADVEWLPSYPGDQQLMYLGPLGRTKSATGTPTDPS